MRSIRNKHSVLRAIRAKWILGAGWNRLDEARGLLPGPSHDRALADAQWHTQSCEALLGMPSLSPPDPTTDTAIEMRLHACARDIKRATPWPLRYPAGLALAVALLAIPAALLTMHLRAAWSNNGCRAIFYRGDAFQERVARRYVPSLLLDCGGDSPVLGMRTNQWSAQFKGALVVPKDGDYVFITQNNDGIRLWVDGSCLIDNWRRQTDWGRSRRKASAKLNAGKHTVRVDYFCVSSNAAFWVRWCGPGIDKPAVIDRRWMRKR